MPGATRPKILLGSAIVTAILAGAALSLPTGFVVRSPGPTADALGMQGNHQLVTIADAETFDPSGQLRLTTVSVSGGPISHTFPGEVLRAWASPSRTTVPTEAVFPRPITQEQQQQQSQAQMMSSQEAATAAALAELGFVVPVTLRVAGAVEGGAAEGIIAEDDVLVSINGHELVEFQQLLEFLVEIAPGDEVTLGVLRDGQLIELRQGTGEAETPDGRPRAALGIWLTSEFRFPIDVQIQIENIGGPSAGMIFALAIVDLLTPLDELGGRVVAGSGTIDADGFVGPVGGIPQKMHGALRDGATYFLVPESNCGDVVGNEPDGLQVVVVNTLAEAVEAITAIGAGTSSTLAACPTN